MQLAKHLRNYSFVKNNVPARNSWTIILELSKAKYYILFVTQCSRGIVCAATILVQEIEGNKNALFVHPVTLHRMFSMPSITCLCKLVFSENCNIVLFCSYSLVNTLDLNIKIFLLMAFPNVELLNKDNKGILPRSLLWDMLRSMLLIVW